MADHEDKITRRELFRRSAVLGAVVAGGGSLLAACGDSGGGEEKLTCTDTSGLEPAQIQTRKSMQYADKSTKEGQTCDNCNFYKAPQKEGTCGTCTVLPGPVHPKGWCSSWAAKQG